MPIKTSRATTDAAIRSYVFDLLNLKNIEGFQPINARQYGLLVTDANNEQRYVRVGVIVAEPRADMTAQELMASEVNAYQSKQAEKAENAKERAAKAERDKAERQRKAAEKAAAKAKGE